MTAARVRENMLERAKKGVWSGGLPPLGYRVNGETKVLEINDDEAKIVRAVFAEFLQSKSVRRTCHTLNALGKYNRDNKPWGYNFHSAYTD